MLKVLKDYDWAEVFGFAGEEDTYNNGTPSSVLSQIPCDISTFTREDVIEIYGMYEGENDGDDWLIAGKLKDGRHFMIEAGCDYTGWD